MRQNAFAAGAEGTYSAPQIPKLDLGEGVGKGGDGKETERKGRGQTPSNKNSGYTALESDLNMTYS